MSHEKRITLISFGFKFGQPNANNYFDVSFLKNPARQPEWGLFSEPDEAMIQFITDQPAFSQFVEVALPLIETLSELDDDMRVGIGCNAGRHRSVIVSGQLANRLRENGHNVVLKHREQE